MRATYSDMSNFGTKTRLTPPVDIILGLLALPLGSLPSLDTSDHAIEAVSSSLPAIGTTLPRQVYCDRVGCSSLFHVALLVLIGITICAIELLRLPTGLSRVCPIDQTTTSCAAQLGLRHQRGCRGTLRALLLLSFTFRTTLSASGPDASPSTKVPACDLCSHQWVFILSTGRAGSTSIMDALNRLPGVYISGENQASLEAAVELRQRRRETVRRGAAVRDHAAQHRDQVDDSALLCTLQQWFVHLAGVPIHMSHSRTPILGFKELITLEPLSVVQDHENTLVPPVRHLSVASSPGGMGKDVEPRWLSLLEEVFPCARIVFNTRSNTTQQAQSAFHRKQGTKPWQLDSLNDIVHQFHARRGGYRSFHLELEEFSEARFTQLAHWLGVACQFTAIPHSNKGSAGPALAGYSNDNESTFLCQDTPSGQTDSRAELPSSATGTLAESHASAAVTPAEAPSRADIRLAEYHPSAVRSVIKPRFSTEDMATRSSRTDEDAIDVTFGVKHMSDYVERRHMLSDLIGSIRTRYSKHPIIVAYEGQHEYSNRGAQDEYYVLQMRPGLSAGRNLIVRQTDTEFVMIMDDDVLFHDGTQVEILLGHLDDLNVALAAACYHPRDCYAHSFLSDGRNVYQRSQPDSQQHAGLQRAEIVHNIFVARTSVLRAHPWDERQQMIEHETFFLLLARFGHVVGFDPRVTAFHLTANKSAAYNVKSSRRQERLFFPYLCRNFPRVGTWSLTYFTVDCMDRTFRYRAPGAPLERLVFDATDDRSVVDYSPGEVSCFIAVMSATSNTRQRDQLRRSWLRLFNQSAGTWDYSFFTGWDGGSNLHYHPGRMLGDVVQLPVPDDYTQLGRKVVRALRWVIDHVEAKFVLKIDEDTWVNAEELSRFLDARFQAPTTSDWYGGWVTQSPVFRTGGWGVPVEVYQENEYPPYVSGGGYFLSRRAASTILQVCLRVSSSQAWRVSSGRWAVHRPQCAVVE